MSARLKREIVLHVKSNREIIEILQAIRKHLRSFNTYARYDREKIRLTVYGSKDDIKFALNEVKSIHKRIRNALYQDANGMYRYDGSLITEKSRVSISLKDLGKILELRGYKVYVQNNTIRTSAKLEEVVKLAREYKKIMDEIHDIQPKIIRKILCIAAIITGVDCKSILKIAISKGIIKYLDDGRYGSMLPPDETCSKLIKEVLTSENKNFSKK